MRQTEIYGTARKRAAAKYGFFIHASVYVAVMILLVVINLLTSPGTVWSIWPLLGWGFAVGLHGARVHWFADRNTILDALTEKEMRRMGADTNDKGS